MPVGIGHRHARTQHVLFIEVLHGERQDIVTGNFPATSGNDRGAAGLIRERRCPGHCAAPRRHGCTLCRFLRRRAFGRHGSAPVTGHSTPLVFRVRGASQMKCRDASGRDRRIRTEHSAP